MCPLQADSTPPPLYKLNDDIVESVPELLAARIDDVMTQREPLMEVSLPVKALPVTSKKHSRTKSKGKGKGKAANALPWPNAMEFYLSDLIAKQGILMTESRLMAWDESEVTGVGCDPTPLSYSTPPKTPFNRPWCMWKVHGPDLLSTTMEMLE